MNKTLIIGIICLVVLLGGFLFLLSQASPDNAPSEDITIELEMPDVS